MLINYSYNAILISSLMVQDFVLPIKTLNDVLNNPSYKLMVLEGTSGETFLKESKELFQNHSSSLCSRKWSLWCMSVDHWQGGWQESKG